jgi:hypothetical protein
VCRQLCVTLRRSMGTPCPDAPSAVLMKGAASGLARCNLAGLCFSAVSALREKCFVCFARADRRGSVVSRCVQLTRWKRGRAAGKSEPENAAQNWPMLNDVIEEAVVLIVYASPPIAEDGGEPVIEVATYASIQVPHEIGGSAEPAGHCPACEVYFRGEVVPALQADDRIHPSVAVARADKLASLIALRVRSTTPD